MLHLSTYQNPKYGNLIRRAHETPQHPRTTKENILIVNFILRAYGMGHATSHHERNLITKDKGKRKKSQKYYKRTIIPPIKGRAEGGWL